MIWYKYRAKMYTLLRCLLTPPSLCPDSVLIRSQLVKAMAEVKKLDYRKQESTTMYVQDLAEFAWVLLATTEMSFDIG
jgi:hypothetical protein